MRVTCEHLLFFYIKSKINRLSQRESLQKLVQVVLATRHGKENQWYKVLFVVMCAVLLDISLGSLVSTEPANWLVSSHPYYGQLQLSE